jgi:hypothetical protein
MKDILIALGLCAFIFALGCATGYGLRLIVQTYF